jgi:hypothetical protein
MLAPAGTTAAYPPSRAADRDPIIIPGSLDEALEEYSNWHQSRVSSQEFKDDIRKARDVAFANSLDLKQIYEDQDWDFFVKNGVKVGAARCFVSDIREWVKQLRWHFCKRFCRDICLEICSKFLLLAPSESYRRSGTA